MDYPYPFASFLELAQWTVAWVIVGSAITLLNIISLSKGREGIIPVQGSMIALSVIAWPVIVGVILGDMAQGLLRTLRSRAGRR